MRSKCEIESKLKILFFKKGKNKILLKENSRLVNFTQKTSLLFLIFFLICFSSISQAGYIYTNDLNPDLNIPDGNTAGVSSKIYIPDGINIGDVNIFVYISHPWPPDLKVTINSPTGTNVLLHNHSGGGNADLYTWFDDEVENSESTYPAEPLSKLDGEDSLGWWELNVADTEAGQSGSLNLWKIEIGRSNSGKGYFVLTNDGDIFSGGVAPDLVGLTPSNCYPEPCRARSLAMGLAGAEGYYILDGLGKIYNFGEVIPLQDPPTFTSDLARALVLYNSNGAYYVMDGFGKIYARGGAPEITGNPTWEQPVAVDFDLNCPGYPGYYILLTNGNIYAGNGADPLQKGSSGLQARALALDCYTGGYYILDNYGDIYGFDGAQPIYGYPHWLNPIATDLQLFDTCGQINLELEADPVVIPPDNGTSSSTITATLTCANTGQSIGAGKLVQFTAVGSVSGDITETHLSANSALTNAQGIAEVTLFSTATPETITITASCFGSQAVFQVIVAEDVGGQVQVSAYPSTINSGGHISEIRAIVTDSEGNPVTDGTLVQFEITAFSGGVFDGQLEPIAYTQSGTASADLTSGNTPGTITVKAKCGEAYDTVEVFITDFQGSMVVTADPSSIPADNESLSAIKVTLKDENNVAIPNAVITLSATLGSIISPVTTGADGVAVSVLTAGLTPGTCIVTATYSTTEDFIAVSVAVEFVGDQADKLTVYANPSSIPANGISISNIMATLTTEGGHGIPGATINFSTNHGIISASAVTNENGKAEGILISDRLNTIATITAYYYPASKSATTQVEFYGVVMGLQGNPTSLRSRSGICDTDVPSLLVIDSEGEICSPVGQEICTLNMQLTDAANFGIFNEQVNLEWVSDHNNNGELDPGIEFYDDNGNGVFDPDQGEEPVRWSGEVRCFASEYGFTNVNGIFVTTFKSEVSGPVFIFAWGAGAVNNIYLFFTDLDFWLIAGEDLDADNNFDNLNEDTNNNGILDPGEDLDQDSYLDTGSDFNHNGILDLWRAEDLKKNGFLYLTEDMNNNGIFDAPPVQVGGYSIPIYALILKDDCQQQAIPDGTLVEFATTTGNVNPNFDYTQNGVAKTTFSSGSITSVATVSAISALADEVIQSFINIPITASVVNRIELSVDPINIAVGGNVAIVTARAYNINNNPVQGERIYFEQLAGPGGGEYLSPGSAVTDEAGEAQTNFYSGNLPSKQPCSVQIRAQASSNGVLSNITCLTISGEPTNIGVGFGEIIAGQATFTTVVTAIVTDVNGNPVADGTQVNFGVTAVGFDEDHNGNGLIDNEDIDGDNLLDLTEDLDGDGSFDKGIEDIDDDGHFDNYDEDANGNCILDDTEDIDGDEYLDTGEDTDHDGILDNMLEPFDDANSNGKYDGCYCWGGQSDKGENCDPYDDENMNGTYDVGEPFEDLNNNGYDGYGEGWKDLDGDGHFDSGFEDLNQNGYLERTEDLDNDGVFNKTSNEDIDGDSIFDRHNEDLDHDLMLDPGEDRGEPFLDSDGNGIWESGELYFDLNDNGDWDQGEPYWDADGDSGGYNPQPDRPYPYYYDDQGTTCNIFNGVYTNYPTGDHPFIDLNGNGNWSGPDGHLDVGEDGAKGFARDGILNTEDVNGDDKLPCEYEFGKGNITYVCGAGQCCWGLSGNDGTVMTTTEDINGNGYLDPGEDINGNGMLDPLNNSTILPIAYTESGLANNGLTYLWNHALNIKVKLTVQSGQATNSITFILPASGEVCPLGGAY